MELLDKYTQVKKELFEYFGYKEDWVVIPLDDATEYWWTLSGVGYGDTVTFAGSKEELITGLEEESGEYYVHEIYTQRFLEKWVYEGKYYTMICVDTCVDGNKFLQIFDNSKEVKQQISLKEKGMIIYSDKDWQELVDNEQLSSGESYFVYDADNKMHLGLMDYEPNELSNESSLIETIDLDGSYWIMEFDWPAPPSALSEKAKEF